MVIKSQRKSKREMYNEKQRQLKLNLPIVVLRGTRRIYYYAAIDSFKLEFHDVTYFWHG